jgi:hypothetical protein
LRGYYPGEREYRKRPQSRIRRLRLPDPRDDLRIPTPPRLRRRGRRRRGELEAAEARPHRRADWVIGIMLGIALGVAVVVAFLLLGSEGTIDAPSIHGVDTGKPAQQARPVQPSQPEPPPPGSEE